MDLESLLSDLNLIEVDVNPEDELENRYICCGEKMNYAGESYYCSICFITKDNINFESPQGFSSTVRRGGRLITSYSTTEKSVESRKADMVIEFKTRLLNQNFTLPEDLIDLTCELLFKVTMKNTKKATNRTYLFAELLRLASIKTGNILTDKEVAKITGLSDTKLSRGSKFVIDAILAGRIENIDLSETLYPLYIKKYLSLYDLNYFRREEEPQLPFKDINDPMNRSYCNNMIEVMLDMNIAYNTTIHSKCIAVVYLLIENFYSQYGSAKERKKYFTSIAEVGESTFIKIYNSLLSEDVFQILIDSGRFKFNYS
jgi:hypothetical protein